MSTLQAALEQVLAELPDDEWAALAVRVRGPHRDYPAKPARTLKNRITKRNEG